MGGGMSQTVWVPLQWARVGRPLVDTKQRQPSPALIRALGLALYWQQQLDQGGIPSVEALAQREGKDISTVSRILHLGLMAPTLVETCLAGQQPRTLNLKRLQRQRLPNDWTAQQQVIDSFL